MQIWRWSQQSGWQQEGPPLVGHKDWVRDVAWAPNLGLPVSTIASAGQDKRVIIWNETSPGNWEPVPLPEFQVRIPAMIAALVLRAHGLGCEPSTRLKSVPWLQGAVFRVSWSVTGNILSVSDSKNSVTLWKEGLDRVWQQIVA